ncbi:hypothetical protein, partial [Cronobacter sakazakii]|uniref:hypothetical protein n=1 Tax=Cronobacter sakazakii TaxID=28141 RepID=UPI001F27BBE6
RAAAHAFLAPVRLACAISTPSKRIWPLIGLDKPDSRAAAHAFLAPVRLACAISTPSKRIWPLIGLDKP